MSPRSSIVVRTTVTGALCLWGTVACTFGFPQAGTWLPLAAAGFGTMILWALGHSLSKALLDSAMEMEGVHEGLDGPEQPEQPGEPGEPEGSVAHVKPAGTWLGDKPLTDPPEELFGAHPGMVSADQSAFALDRSLDLFADFDQPDAPGGAPDPRKKGPESVRKATFDAFAGFLDEPTVSSRDAMHVVDVAFDPFAEPTPDEESADVQEGTSSGNMETTCPKTP